MLAPVAEAQFGEDALLELNLRAAAGFPAFCAELAAASGRDPGLRATRHARRGARPRRGRGARPPARLPAARSGSTVERLLPTPRAPRRAGARADRAARARRRRRPLRRPAPARRRARRGRARAPAARVRARRARRRPAVDGERVTGVALADGDDASPPARCSSPRARTPRGSTASRPAPPCPSARSRARCCGCATRTGPGLVERTIRTRDAYLVPRADGRYVLGATMEERGLDTAPTAGGVFELLRDISEVVPGVLELELEELLAGLRPATPDNLPAIGRRRARGPLLGDRPLPQRHPALRPDRRAGRRRAVRRAAARLGGRRRSRPLRAGAGMTIVVNGEPRELAPGTTVSALLDGARRARRRARASRSRSTPRSCRAASGRRPSSTTARGSRSCARSREAEAMSVADVRTRPARRSPGASSARGCCSARAASARSRRSPPRSRRAAPSSSPSRCAGSTRPRAARSSTCSTPPACSCCRTPPAASRRATRCSPRSSRARRSAPTGSSSR